MVTRQLSSHVVGRRQAEWETSSCLDFSCSIYPVPGLPVHGLILFPFSLGSPSLVFSVNASLEAPTGVPRQIFCDLKAS